MDAGLQAVMMFVGSLGGGALGAFWKTKAENEAMRQDVGELTRITKRIEDEISSDTWSRQKRWELKQRVLFETTRRVSAAFEALKDVDNVLQTEIKYPIGKDIPSWAQLKVDHNTAWFRASAALNESRLFISVTCSDKMYGAINEFIVFMTMIASAISNKDPEIFENSTTRMFALQDAVRDAIRTELEIGEQIKSKLAKPN
jgi:hypothetical protein